MKRTIRKIVNHFGYDLIKLKILTDEDKQFIVSDINKNLWIQNFGINTVINVGAHVGQSTLKFRKMFPDAFIYSFEPLIDNYKKLLENCKTLKKHKALNLALGDSKSSAHMNRNEFTQSSSLLSITEEHKEAYPFAVNSFTEEVRMDTLDNIFGKIDLRKNVLLKIDTQGYESKVLQGASKVLPNIKVIFVETSFTNLYKDQKLFEDIFNLLVSQNFVYSGSLAQHHNPQNGKPLQQDSIFINRN